MNESKKIITSKEIEVILKKEKLDKKEIEATEKQILYALNNLLTLKEEVLDLEQKISEDYLNHNTYNQLNKKLESKKKELVEQNEWLAGKYDDPERTDEIFTIDEIKKIIESVNKVIEKDKIDEAETRRLTMGN